MTYTDYIIIAAFLYFFFSGWRKGLIKTLFGPLSLIAGFLGGLVYYNKNGDLIAALGISIVSPFIINILASLLLKLWNKAVDDKAELSTPSRAIGGTINLLWAGSYLGITLFLIGIVPLDFPKFNAVQEDVVASKTYAAVRSIVDARVPKMNFDMKNITSVLENPEKLEQIQSSEEFKDLHEDEDLKAILTDDKIAEHIENKDYGALLADPKMREVLRNKELLDKIMAVNKKILEEEPAGASGPRIIEIEADPDPENR